MSYQQRRVGLIVLYAVLSAVILIGAAILLMSGNRMEPAKIPKETAERTAVTETEADAESETKTETETKSETETDAGLTEAETELRLAPLPEESEEEDAETEAAKPIPVLVRRVRDDDRGAPDELIGKLRRLLTTEKPDRWTYNEAEELVEVPATVTYLYHNLATGDTVCYGADTVRYAASLIKIPYIYSVLREIENFEADPANHGEDGALLYDGERRKYNLSEGWKYDPDTMLVEGSGQIMEEEPGFTLTWRELFEYAILYSDNVAVDQIQQRFGMKSFYELVGRLGLKGTASGFMNLSPHDCMLVLREVYVWFAGGSEYGELLKNAMIHSKYPEMISRHYPNVPVCHKYGWDIDAYHDMAIIYDEDPYLLVIMTDYDDGDEVARNYYQQLVSVTKEIHAFYSAEPDGTVNPE